MKWGHRKEDMEKALSATKSERSMASALIPKKDLSREDYDAIKVALRWGDEAHYSQLSEENFEVLNRTLDKAKKLSGSVERSGKIADIDKKIEKLNKAAMKAEHYGGNESGDHDTVSSIEKQIKSLEAEKQKLSKK